MLPLLRWQKNTPKDKEMDIKDLQTKLDNIAEAESNMQYAIINFTKQTTEFYADFDSASAAITEYPVGSDVVAIVDLAENAVEIL